MAVPIHNPLRGNGVERRSIAITIFMNGTSDPATITDPNDDISGVAYTATGIYTITFNYPVEKLLSVTQAVSLASGADVTCQGRAFTPNTGSNFTAQVQLMAGASGVAPAAANANSFVCLTFEVELSDAA